jgi:hypothetical protein
MTFAVESKAKRRRREPVKKKIKANTIVQLQEVPPPLIPSNIMVGHEEDIYSRIKANTHTGGSNLMVRTYSTRRSSVLGEKLAGLWPDHQQTPTRYIIKKTA